MLEALEAWAPVAALRQSLFVYPLVNAAHILGVALLVGSIVALDLRLAGLWSRTPWQPLWQVLTGTAQSGFALAAVSGLALFATRATEYVDSGLFLAKLGLIVLALLNAAWLALRLRSVQVIGPLVRLGGIFSALAWVVVLVLGRLVGYF